MVNTSISFVVEGCETSDVKSINLDLKVEIKQKTPRAGIRRLPALILPLLSGICYTLTFVAVKKLKGKYEPITMLFWRYVAFVICSIFLLLSEGFLKGFGAFRTVWPEEGTLKQKLFGIGGLSVACVLNIIIVIMGYYTQKYISVSDTITISFCGPSFTVILGHLFLGEKCGWIQLPVSILILLGVGIIARPPILTGNVGYDNDVLFGTGLAVALTILWSIYFVAMRRYRQVHYGVNSLLHGLLGMIAPGIIGVEMHVFSYPKTLIDALLLLVGLGFFGFLTVIFLIIALKFENAGIVDLLRGLNVIFSFLLEFVLLGTVPDEYSIIGSIIVVTGVGLITIRTILLSQPAENKMRKLFWFLLK